MSFRNGLVSMLVNQKKYQAIQEYLQIEFPKEDGVMVLEYAGERPRLFKNTNDDIVLMLPDEMDTYMENAVTRAIEDGTLFDDAKNVSNTAEYIRMTTLPYNGMMNKGYDEPKALKSAVGSVVGTMNADGRFGGEDSDLQNGYNAMHDMVHHANDSDDSTFKLIGDYIKLKDNGKLPVEYRRDIGKVKHDVKNVNDVDCEDCISSDDYKDLELTDECGSSVCYDEEDTLDMGDSGMDSVDTSDISSSDMDASSVDTTTECGDDEYQEAYLSRRISSYKHGDSVSKGKYTDTSDGEMDLSLYNLFQTTYGKLNHFYSNYLSLIRVNNLTKALGNTHRILNGKKEIPETITGDNFHVFIKERPQFENIRTMLEFEISKINELANGDEYFKKDSRYLVQSCNRLIKAIDTLLDTVSKSNNERLDVKEYDSFIKAYTSTLKVHKMFLRRFRDHHDLYSRFDAGKNKRSHADEIDQFVKNEKADYQERKRANSVGGKLSKFIKSRKPMSRQLAYEYCIDVEDAEWLISEYGIYDPETDTFIQESDFIDDSADNVSNDTMYQEGFFTKKPKKLKPIPRDIIPYITIEANNIKDANDQQMIAGYTCSKLELVDFYLNCLDTQDDRYIVPHTRQYLVQMQNDLNRLLTQILHVRPVNKMDRMWKVGVNLPG